MISFGSTRHIFVSTRPVDFRKGVHGLAAIVADSLKRDPFSGDVFVFRAKRKDRLKILVFDGTGMVLGRVDEFAIEFRLGIPLRNQA